MYYVYLLNCRKDGSIYIGYSTDLKNRFLDHSLGKVVATKYLLPVELLYYESYQSKKLAQERERQLKKFGSAYSGLLKRLGRK